ncbi:GNAT family N-acetyltransferase [Novosphingobium album (ex Hu et al. 2023)]|uniref:GNAT family N-acetyltransferase n=1 Tax=Novosphingobium album (ex Hu et al. 2023) TaxID=2930093 RepID=A0ABT0B7B2_9SPHN|nr:GNAT family N-acetyltransferase [Novosphingobium album (ex Hu et al. 2023)]MCJ2180919.1 GNAT family N-acetyltransferase [Novosphingobium album (ex Hu et al. 2023)]
MTLADLPRAVELSTEQSWPHRHEDWDLFFEMGEGIVAECDGQVIGTVMAWRYGSEYASIGMMIVTPEKQREGIGRQLLEAMMARLEGVNILVHATAESLPLYTRLGFNPIAEVRQHQGLAPTMPLAALRPGERVRPMGATDVELSKLYSQASGMDREAVFERVARESQSIVLSREHEPVGVALMRRFGRGRVLAPIVAPDLGGAQALATHWLGAKAGKFCRADAVAGTGFPEWLEDIGLQCTGTVTLMVHGKAPPVCETARLFAVASQAFG